MQCPLEWIGNQCGSSGQGVCPVVAGVLGVTHDPGGEYCLAGIKEQLEGRVGVDEGTSRGADMEDM